MKKISFWASTHITAARILIVILKLLLYSLAYYVGMGLYKMQIILPVNPVYESCLLALLIVLLIYPDAHKKIVRKKWYYLQQKSCDFILQLCSCLIIITTVNNADRFTAHSFVYASVAIKVHTAKEILASGKTKESLSRKEKQILKKEFFKQLKVYATATLKNDSKASGEAWKTILAIIGLVGLLYLLAALVCTLSCNGSDTAAVMVGILGLAGLIWAFIVVLKAIQRGPKKKEPKVE